MKTSTFSFYSDKNTFTIDKLKLIKPTEIFPKPERTCIWLAKNKIWHKFCTDEAFNLKSIKYQYKVKVDMTDIHLLTLDNFQNFFKLYKKTHYNIDWNKFITNNPTCRGIYLTFDPRTLFFSNNIKFPLGRLLTPTPKSKKKLMHSLEIIYPGDRAIPDVLMFILFWDIPSLCVWDKSAILVFKLIDEK